MTDEQLIALAREAAAKAYAPYSNFHVGCAIESVDGEVVTGANMENACYRLGICAEQKAMFGKAFQYVPYVECAIKGSRELAPACSAAGVKLFPSWQFGSNPPKEGVYPLEELSDKTGCALP